MLKPVLALFSLLFLITSCNDSAFFYESHQTQGFWYKDSIVNFNFKAPDTLKPYNFYIHIRNTKDYNYSNLFLITSMQFPHGKVVVDTLEYKMAFKDGRLMGEGFGSLKDNKLWYKENLKFTENGEYQLKIRQAMRKPNEIKTLEKLKGIEEIGFSFEPVKPKKQ